jgi:hypothetical protein
VVCGNRRSDLRWYGIWSAILGVGSLTYWVVSQSVGGFFCFNVGWNCLAGIKVAAILGIQVVFVLFRDYMRGYIAPRNLRLSLRGGSAALF